MAIKRKNRIIVFLAVLGLLIFLHYIGILRPVESAINKVANPLLSYMYSLGSGVRSSFNERADKTDLRNKIYELNMEVVRLTEANAKINTAQEENELLREHLDFLTKNEYKYVMANVVSRGETGDVSGVIEVVSIDKGTKDGLYVGLGVVGSEGVLIGKIVEVKNNISKVYLTNNNRCKIAAAVTGQNRTSGIAEGELGLTIKMGFIPQGDKIEVNDIVVTSGLEQYIPRGLVVGRVTEVNSDSNELWQSARLVSVLDSDDLIIVSVLLP